MKIGITSIQRDRNPYIVEWIAFHLAMGFTDFFIYSHKCSDGMNDTIRKLAEHYSITLNELEDDAPPQLPAYWDAIVHYVPHVDWMAFIDGDEFLFPTQHDSIVDTLTPFNEHDISALGVYWMLYGSSGHLVEPAGLITENFIRHQKDGDRHVKTILRGRNQAQVHRVAAHVFETDKGTFDEQMRPIATGWERVHEPSFEHFRINHYVTQSYDFYRHKKRHMGAADVDASKERDAAWFKGCDRNECDDGIRYQFLLKLKLKIEEINGILNSATQAEPKPELLPVPKSVLTTQTDAYQLTRVVIQNKRGVQQ